MGRFSKTRLDEMDDYASIRDELFTKEEQANTDREAALELHLLKSMQEELTKELAAFMASENIGIVQLTNRLKTSTRQTNRIMSGEANVTLATLASIGQLIGKKPRLIFDDDD